MLPSPCHAPTGVGLNPPAAAAAAAAAAALLSCKSSRCLPAGKHGVNPSSRCQPAEPPCYHCRTCEASIANSV